MSVSLMSLVFNCNMPELMTDDGKTVPDTTAKSILLALADNANEEGEGSYPGVDTLCRKTNYSTSTVCNALNALRHNGFTVLVGRSKRDTNNYTVSVAEILKFQWPKREDSSHRNAGVSATETNPSVTDSKPPISKDVSEIVEAANKTVDFILGQCGKQKVSWAGREKILESLWPLADLFVALTGLKPSKKELMYWMGEWSDWRSWQATPQDIKDALDHSRRDPGGFMVSSPASLSKTVRAIAAKRIAKESATPPPIQSQPIPELPPQWQKYYERAT